MLNNTNNNEFCGDMLIEIFLKIPVKSLFRFKCLSRKWNQVFSSVSFRSKYVSIHSVSSETMIPPLGFFQSFDPLNLSASWYLGCDSCDTRFHDFSATVDMFLAASNGVILCGIVPRIYLVCDPITGRAVVLPTGALVRRDVGFHYEQVRDEATGSVSANFRVVVPQMNRFDTMSINTYSSERKVWEESILQGCGIFSILDDYPSTVIHGIFYWITYAYDIVVYDPNYAYYSNWVWLLRIPQTQSTGNCVLGESEQDRSLLLALEDYPGFRVLKLAKNVHSYGRKSKISHLEWASLYCIYYLPWPALSINIMYWECDPTYPRLIAFHPQSFHYLLMRIGKCVFWLDLVSKKRYIVKYYGEISLAKKSRLFPFYFSQSWPWPPTLP